MEVKQMLFFYTVAKIGNVTRAAEQLMVAQPFLSKTISSLEKELGATLFDRIKNRITLNERGIAFYKRAHRILNEISSAKKEIADMVAHVDNNVVLATNMCIYLPDVLSKFYIEHPEIKVHQRSGTRQYILRLLEDGEADYAILTPTLKMEKDSIFAAKALIRGEIRFTFSPNHRFNKLTELYSHDLVNEPIVTMPKGYGLRDLIDFAFEKAKIEPNQLIETGETSVMATFIKNGLGVGVLPLSFINSDPVLNKRALFLKDARIMSTIDLVYVDGKYKTSAKKCLESFVIEYFKIMQKELFDAEFLSDRSERILAEL